ncbi:receptor-like protein Cf-9 homolog [Capsicum annuum]|uniref:receptor-like protein Cf-9 homolog n=1 Tax=Capsicum annuum TaxID=4072 RepID=UPI001FB0F885|nr:receptor-like protein Cf-9 homolog [Capsicum annuum]
METLDLSCNDQLNGYFSKIKWNSSASLKHLDLVGVNFSGNYLLESLGYLTSLQRLISKAAADFGSFQISRFNEEFLIGYFLNLSRNHLERCIPKRPQFATYENNSYEGNDGLRGFLVSGGCGSNLIPKKNNKTFVPNEEGDSTFLNELCWEVVLMRYGCGLIIGFSIAYVMLSYQKPNWLSRIAEELEYIISMRNRKKPRE